MLLENKICFITGAGRGIGKAILERFVEEGASKIYANTVTEGRLDTFCAEHPQVIPLYFDVSDKESAQKAMMRIRKESERLDVLVNNAGITKDELTGMIDWQTMEEVFTVNVYGTVELLQLAARAMIQTGGSIINIASTAGVRGGGSGQLVYSGTKGAIIALTKTAARELGAKGIRVNAVAPGLIDTDMTRAVDEKIMLKTLPGISLGRFGNPREVADACVYLASDLSSYVSGQILTVDGASFN